MTPRTNGRLAGFMFLLYIVVGITHMVIMSQATGGGEDTAAKLASIARHASLMRVSVVLTLLEAICAMVIAVTIYTLTRDQDRDLAILAMTFRVAESVVGFASVARPLGLLSIATSSAAAPVDPAAANALGGLLLKSGGPGAAGAFCFALGSTIYCYLFLRAQSIPVPLAWLGLLSSVLWVIVCPLQMVDVPVGPITWVMYPAMLLFEVTLALWLIIKGVRERSVR
jgi:hypothetical protein